MVVNANIYNHLSTALVPKKRNITHKSSELKAIYSNMASYNKSSPLFLIKFTEENQSRMINIKEAALTLKESFDSFSNENDDIYSGRLIHSSDTSIISGSLKKNTDGRLPDNFNIEIKSLARGQINKGNYIDSDARAFIPRTHSFALETADKTSNFSISVSHEDTNLDVQSKIADYINNRDLGIQASVVFDGDKSALILASNETGAAKSEDGLYFNVTDSSNSGQDMVAILGLNQLAETPSNSEFSINGQTHYSKTNNISINNSVWLDFHSTTDKPVEISFVSDSSKAIEQIDAFIEAYNKLANLSRDTSKTNIGTRSLSNDIAVLLKDTAWFDEVGISKSEDGMLVRDSEKTAEALSSDNFSEFIQNANKLKSSLTKITDRLTLDPVAYVNKLIVTYPNNNNKFNTPYTQSLYSGFLYNNYA